MSRTYIFQQSLFHNKSLLSLLHGVHLKISPKIFFHELHQNKYSLFLFFYIFSFTFFFINNKQIRLGRGPRQEQARSCYHEHHRQPWRRPLDSPRSWKCPWFAATQRALRQHQSCPIPHRSSWIKEKYCNFVGIPIRRHVTFWDVVILLKTQAFGQFLYINN